MRFGAIILGLASVMGLSTCGAQEAAEEPSVVNEMDPYLARALNDPLMVDPDLAYRNEANAAITLGYDHALPSFKRSDEAASRARETARLELLEDGPIEDLPPASDGTGPASLEAQFAVEAVLETLQVPLECRANVKGSFAFAATMPAYARIMPHGMVRVAAATEQDKCDLRLVRYVTPAAIEDALQYHFTIATREGLEPAYFTQPEASLIAERRAVHVQVYARKTSGDLTAVDIITWKRP